MHGKKIWRIRDGEPQLRCRVNSKPLSNPCSHPQKPENEAADTDKAARCDCDSVTPTHFYNPYRKGKYLKSTPVPSHRRKDQITYRGCCGTVRKNTWQDAREGSRITFQVQRPRRP